MTTFKLKNTARGFNVYSGPGTSYDRVKMENSNSAVYILPLAKRRNDPAYFVSTVDTDTTNTILGKDTDKAVWYQIRVQYKNIDITGWIRAAHVETDDDLSGLGIAWRPLRLRLATAEEDVNVHAAPGTRHRVVAAIHPRLHRPIRHPGEGHQHRFPGTKSGMLPPSTTSRAGSRLRKCRSATSRLPLTETICPSPGCRPCLPTPCRCPSRRRTIRERQRDITRSPACSMIPDAVPRDGANGTLEDTRA